MGSAVWTGLVPTLDGCRSLEATPTTGMLLHRHKRHSSEEGTVRRPRQRSLLHRRTETPNRNQRNNPAVASQAERKATALILQCSQKPSWSCLCTLLPQQPSSPKLHSVHSHTLSERTSSEPQPKQLCAEVAGAVKVCAQATVTYYFSRSGMNLSRTYCGDNMFGEKTRAWPVWIF